MRSMWEPEIDIFIFSLSILQALASHRAYLLSARIPTKVRTFTICFSQNHRLLCVEFELQVVLGLEY